MRKILLPFVSILLFGMVFTQHVKAFTMSNLLYILSLGNLNSIAGESTSPSNKLRLTVGQTGAGYYSGTNYILCAGFYGGVRCAKQTHVFSFTISSTFIDFGGLTPNTPVSRTNTLTVSDTGEAGASYIVTVNENHQLALYSNSSWIPDTTCDDGLCTPSSPSPWVIHSGTSLTYGFGYRCDNLSGSECLSGFSTATYFAPFIASPSAQTVMSGTTGTNQQVQITYRANASASQPPGLYSNIITYIAVPTY
ncbi:MAG TPA: hypothetical protein VGT05_04420 [Patescibacteria group bacterium]|nr:hypothetical protein [Patescibacteria group bacterium]